MQANYINRLSFATVVLTAVLFVCVPQSASANDVDTPDVEVISEDSSVVEPDTIVNEVNPDPEWYVAPVISEKFRAPKRATAADKCLTDSIVTYDIDENLTKVSNYDYDGADNVIRVTEWEYNAGVRVGKSKQEFGFDASGTQIMSAIYVWDNSANNWRGSEKAEFTYNDAKQIISSIIYTWVNREWTPDTKYTYVYDNEGREVEYYAYARDAVSNTLVPTSGHIQFWNDDKKTLDVQYTAYSNGAWSEGTQKVWAYDDAGNQIEYAYYSSLSNGKWVGDTREIWAYTSGKKTYYEKQSWADGAWVGSSKEIWTFGGPSGQQTLHEQYSYSDDWTITLQENSSYDDAGNNTLVENYKLVKGVWTGTKKVEYSFNASKKKTSSVTYAWSDGAWVGSVKEKWEFNASGKQTLHEKYSWVDSDWDMTLQENSGYDESGNNTLVENYASDNGVWTGTKKEEYSYNTSKKKTSTIVYLWFEGDWVLSDKEVWGFSSSRQTLHEQYVWGGTDWIITLQEKSGYDAAGNTTLVEICKLVDGEWTGEKKEEYTFNAAKQKIVTIVSAWNGSEWVYSTKAEADYRGDEQIVDARYIWQDGAWGGDGYRVEKVYEGEKISLLFNYAWDATDAKWAYSARRVYEYDDQGRMVGDTTQFYIDSKWENSAIVTHGYDAHGNDTLSVTARWTGTEWEPTYISKGTYTYTESDQPLLIESYIGLPDSWTGVQKLEYTYNEAGKQTLYMAYEWGNGKWVNKSRSQQDYDAANHLIFRQTQNWLNNRWENFSKYEYAYDDNGNQIREAQYNGDKTTWVGFSCWERVYENGQMIQYTKFTWKSKAWRGSTREDYTYDEKGRLVEKIQSSFRDNSWYNKERYTYEYDERGQKVSDRRYWWDDEKWAIYTIDDKEYDLSDNKLRREINGLWSDGELESYEDKHYFYSCDNYEYTIRFVNHDGTELASYVVSRGQKPAYSGATPTKPGDAQYTYTFAGWDKEVVAATHEATYTATFSQTVNEYTITWLNDDNSQIDQTQVEYGKVPTHTDATKAATAQYTYTFKEWTPTIVAVTGAATYTAEFDSVINAYAILFKNGDEVLQSSEVEFGTLPTYNGEIPTKAATDQYTYTFKEWTPEIVAVSGAATYTAEFDSVVNTYTITWLNDDDTEIDQTTVEYGAVPEHADAVKENTAEWTYTFTGWDNDLVAVTGDATYKATFTAEKNKYVITFLDEDGTELDSQEWEYGALPTCDEPGKEEDAKFTYMFAGWIPEVEIVTADATYKATYDATEKLATGLPETEIGMKAEKVLINGQMYIIRDGQMYNTSGVVVK